jgi:hypothetical protein
VTFSIVWSGHWCTLLQCIFSDPIIYPVPSHDLHFQHQMVLPPFLCFSEWRLILDYEKKVKTVMVNNSTNINRHSLKHKKGGNTI